MENINTLLETKTKEFEIIQKEYNEEKLNYNRYLYNLKNKFLDALNSLLLSSEQKELGYLDYDNSYIRINNYFDDINESYLYSTIYMRNKSNDRLDFSLNIKKDMIEINKPSSGYYSKKSNNLYVLLDYICNLIWENEQNIICLLWKDYEANQNKIEIKEETIRAYYKTQRELTELKDKKDHDEFLSLLKSKKYIGFLRQTYYEPDRDTSNYKKIFYENITSFYTISNVEKIKNITEKNVIIVDKHGYRSYIGIYNLFADYKSNHVVLLDNENQTINDTETKFYERSK